MYEDIYKDLLDKLTYGHNSVLLTFMDPIDKRSGDIKKKIVLTENNIKENLNSIDNKETLIEKIFFTLESGYPEFIDNENGEVILIEPYFPKPRLIIFGGGHIASPLSEFGDKVGFSVVVVDDRPFFANSNRFPKASQVICDSFENAFETIKPHKSDFIVIVTRGHKYDGLCLRKSLGYDLKYVGMIGSKRRVKGVMDQLLSEGFSQEQLDRVNSPIGLHIGAVTPEEIAVSIIAEVISFRRKGKSGNYIKKSNWPEFDPDVIEEMTKIEDPKALVTITSSKGSVPRKAGAKMIVWYDGRTMGSIGGGCSEGGIINIARDVILNKGYATEHVDMTGEVAESEGMVCGGTMEVLIESF